MASQRDQPSGTGGTHAHSSCGRFRFPGTAGGGVGGFDGSSSGSVAPPSFASRGLGFVEGSDASTASVGSGVSFAGTRSADFFMTNLSFGFPAAAAGFGTGDGASGDGASGDGAPGDGAPGDGASGDGASGDGASGDGASGDGARRGRGRFPFRSGLGRRSAHHRRHHSRGLLVRLRGGERLLIHLLKVHDPRS